MKKVLTIEGMTCMHCSGRVNKALNALDGVEAFVSLEEKQAQVTAKPGVSNQTLMQAVSEAGYEVTEIKELA